MPQHVRQEVSPNGAATSSGEQRAAIYTRVSTQEQSDHGYSLGAQEQDCRKLAEELPPGCYCLSGHRQRRIVGSPRTQRPAGRSKASGVFYRPGVRH